MNNLHQYNFSLAKIYLFVLIPLFLLTTLTDQASKNRHTPNCWLLSNLTSTIQEDSDDFNYHADFDPDDDFDPTTTSIRRRLRFDGGFDSTSTSTRWQLRLDDRNLPHGHFHRITSFLFHFRRPLLFSTFTKTLQQQKSLKTRENTTGRFACPQKKQRRFRSTRRLSSRSCRLPLISGKTH